MKYEISKEICDEARCENDYSCLLLGQCGECGICVAHTAIYKDGLLLDTYRKLVTCAYHMSCDFGDMCLCPVRFAIFQKYHV